MADIVMPRLSDTMEEGTILRWHKRSGDQVHRGDELVEIETDKASMTYASDQDGVLELVAAEGDTLPVGQVIARTGAEQQAPLDAPAAPGAPGPEPATATDVLAVAAAQGSPQSNVRVKASPLAKRIAAGSGVALDGLKGSGPGGRIVAADVQAAAAVPAPDEGAGAQKGAEAPPPGAAGATAAPPVADVLRAKGESSSRELSRTQQLIARRMAESKATIPHFALQVEIDMEACVVMRAQLAEHVQPAAATARTAPTYNDMAVKACALALREHPRVNGSYRDGRIQLHSRVNVGVAVAVETEDPLDSALVVPTVFDADIKSLGEIARETRVLAQRVREGIISPPELSGGTFTVSNLGMHGVHSFQAIINPPQAAILSLGSLAPRAVVRGGGIVPRHTMMATLACDHRMLYGADAARFLGRIRELLEQPAALTL
jgi:pyruvate dehydrogenase E2 component (dihydrolipoamide acetyltransferase)